MAQMWKREGRQLKERKKIEARVFDPETLIALEKLIRSETLSSVEVMINEGKEARVFWGKAGQNVFDAPNGLAVKVYKIETSNFQHMEKYIYGDPRFETVKKTKKQIVYAWVKKEFRNLEICREAGVLVPRQRAFLKNVLVMDFIGEETVPADLLKDVELEDPEETFEILVSYVKKMYKAGLVHGDLSEYNIMIWDEKPWLIDIGQGVLLGHPLAQELLKKDIYNLVKFFAKKGIKRNEKEVLQEVKR